MKLKILRNTFDHSGRRTPDVLMKDSIVELPDEQAQVLIEKGAAEEVKPPKPAKSETPDDSWTVPELKKYAEEHEIDLGTATKKPDILALIQPTL